ncbi:MAG: kynureninase [Cyclobacteriaceae bacterium]|nr:kynureninase [Cyclobacteriaceae bacterium]
MNYENSLSFARRLDQKDPLKKYRKEFHIPVVNGKPSIYLCGNSLGLEPRRTRRFLLEELEDWAKLGVEGHLHGRRPWLYYHHFTKKPLAKLVGAKPSEVVAMNQLTVNLHLMLTTFYRPDKKRFKIITEAGAFSSDQYAVESQLRLHGIHPEDALVELSPRNGEHYLRTSDILQAISDEAGQLALVLFGGVQYYSGQFFDLKAITSAAHAAGAMAGFDLAHAVGNVPLALHRDEVDFAVWCSYKYLNSGPGSVAGAFVHERHADGNLPRMAGWWGHYERDRFKMKKGFIAMPGVDGWQLSNFPILTGAAHLASLEIFSEVGMPALRRKSVQLTGYLSFLLDEIDPGGKHYTVITPRDASARGCQLSILMNHQRGKRVFDALTRRGVIADWREPDVIRVAPVPLYNTFEDVHRFATLLAESL